jgi:hypothetical protein
MGKVIVMPSAGNTLRGCTSKQNHLGMTTSDFRRFLTNLPLSYRAFLRNLLKRALAARGPDRFPVTILATPTP